MGSGEIFWSKMMLVFVLLIAREALGQDPCLTPSRSSGACINIRQCQPLVNVLRKPRPLSTQDLDLLKNSQCGFDGNDPKVCCEVQTTPTTSSPTTPSSSATFPPPDVSSHPKLRLLNSDLCGPITEPKIFGGNKTTVFEFPWMALVAYKMGQKDPEFRCGGSLINKHYVLTAAHCVTLLPSGLELIGVRVGEHDLSKERDCDKDSGGLEVNCAERYQDFLVESSVAHPDYSRERLQNDIALIRIKGEADFRPDNVRPICLPFGEASSFTQKKATVTGWGATETGPRSQDLLKVRLPIVTNEQCAESYRSHQVQIWYKQVCAGGANKMDSCSGDSGGPLQAPALFNGQPRYIQYGVVSFGPRNCGIEGMPGVYTRVAYYLDWILNTIRE